MKIYSCTLHTDLNVNQNFICCCLLVFIHIIEEAKCYIVECLLFLVTFSNNPRMDVITLRCVLLQIPFSQFMGETLKGVQGFVTAEVLYVLLVSLIFLFSHSNPMSKVLLQYTLRILSCSNKYLFVALKEHENRFIVECSKFHFRFMMYHKERNKMCMLNFEIIWNALPFLWKNNHKLWQNVFLFKSQDQFLLWVESKTKISYFGGIALWNCKLRSL